jgi:hypothetical protein
VAAKTVKDAVSAYGAALKPKLSNPAIAGQPEDQLRGPLDTLVRDVSAVGGSVYGRVSLVGETNISDIRTRPDFAVTVDDALVGFIEVKAPGKGADPRRFAEPHDREQWQKLRSLPNLLYTDGGAFSLWRDGELVGKVVALEGDVATSGARLTAPDALLPLISDFLTWKPIPPANAKQLARVAARLCRLLRDEVLEQLERKSPGLTALASDWRKQLFPKASDFDFADGYARRPSPSACSSRAPSTSRSQAASIRRPISCAGRVR